VLIRGRRHTIERTPGPRTQTRATRESPLGGKREKEPPANIAT
jgi:hypothetical protein